MYLKKHENFNMYLSCAIALSLLRMLLFSVASPRDFLILIPYTEFLYVHKYECGLYFSLILLLQNGATWDKVQSTALNFYCLMVPATKARLA